MYPCIPPARLPPWRFQPTPSPRRRLGPGAALVLGALIAAAPAQASTWEAAARLEANAPTEVLAALGDAKSAGASYLRGRAREAAGDGAGAAREYGAAAAGLPALADELFVRQGEAWLAAKKAAEASRAFAAALQRTRGRPSAFKERAVTGSVRAACERGHCEGAARLLDEGARIHEVPVRSAALLAIAQCYERSGATEPGSLREAAQRYDRLAAFRPKSDAAETARQALRSLAARSVAPPPMSVEEGLRAIRVLRWAKRLDDAKARLAKLHPQSNAEERLVRFERGELHHAENQHEEALRVFRALHDERPREAGSEGYLRMAARSLKALGHAEKAARTLLEADTAAKGPGRNGRDLWRAGELFLQAGKAEPAAKAWLLLARRESGHKDAPRAFIRAIEAFLELEQHALARKAADRFPAGWARRRIAWRARFLGAWAAYRKGDREDARRRFRRLAGAARAPKLDVLRAQYWLARLDEADGKAKGRASYQALLAAAPTSFYADVATSRLRALGVAVPDAPPAPPATLPPEPAPEPVPDRRRPRSLPQATASALAAMVRAHGKELPQLARALALARLGLVREAALALESARRDVDAARRRPSRVAAFGTSTATVPLTEAQRRRRNRLRKLERAAFALRLAPLYRDLGERALQAQQLRRFGRAAEGRRARKEGPYPRPYADLIQAAGGSHGVPESLLFAIMRTESAFRTDALSVVGARGLMQIMPRTGQRIAARRGDTLAPGALDEPALSIKYGAWYLRELLLKYKGQLPLAIAAYNGGPAAVSRWLDARGRKLATDEFLEELSFTETRRYVRKVLRSMRSYDQVLRGSIGAYVRAELEPAYGDNIDF